MQAIWIGAVQICRRDASIRSTVEGAIAGLFVPCAKTSRQGAKNAKEERAGEMWGWLRTLGGLGPLAVLAPWRSWPLGGLGPLAVLAQDSNSRAERTRMRERACPHATTC